MNPETRKTLSLSATLEFRRLIYDHYEREGRRFPWRQTRDHYRILVSEIMLQQTQTNRVVEKYAEFIAAFPDISALARAPLRSILSVWQGLGYNRRALCLKELAETVVARHEGRIPGTVEELKKLPGLGPATAASVAAFAFNRPVVFLETNIRTVFIHHFFPGKGKVSDTEILPLAEAVLDRENPRRWYNALMDYGAMLKKTGANPGRRSAHYTRQAPFQGSDRQIRGRIVRLLTGHPSLTGNELIEKLDDEPRRVRHILDKLVREGLVREEKQRYRIS